MCISLAYERADRVLPQDRDVTHARRSRLFRFWQEGTERVLISERPYRLAASDDHKEISFAKDLENWLRGVEFEVKRLPFQGSL
jgi:hypothetical protein